ncbi:MAG: class I SAM-dependent methyltransferase [Verrucomicrobia bacterium]|nr:MAG: class I SAM-dependent methyltransferase [Verrucomicrobiota bacterium]
MGNEFYAPGEQRAAKVNALFATIARRYDLINDLQSLGLHRRWKRRVAELAAPQPGANVLDVCCGTGDIAFTLTARGAQVTGVDFSEPMLEVARGRGQKPATATSTTADLRPLSSDFCPPTSPAFCRGDALQLAFADASFDAVTIGYGLRNLASWQRGLEEMSRVTKPGGRLVVLEFGKPANALWRGVYFAYLRLAVPVLGLVFCGKASAYAYILESLKAYPGQDGVAARMREMGLRNVRVENFLFGAMAINYGEKPD